MSKHRLSRRTALVGLALASAVAPAAEAASEDEVRATLLRFLDAFEACDLAAMEAGFAPDALTFDPTMMSREGTPKIDAEEFRRKAGMSPGMRRICTAALQSGRKPPYVAVKPVDLSIQMGADMAVCSFHLETQGRLARRTIVLAKRADAWKIIHLHASNVQTA